MTDNLDAVIKVRVSRTDRERLQAVCDAEGVTVSTMLRQRIRESLLSDEVSDWE